MTFKEFVKTKTFYKHLLLIIASFLVLIFIVSLLLKVYTRHGSEYTIPKIEGKLLQDVENSDELSDFEIVVLDSIHKDGIPYGTILSQDPAPGSIVKSGRKIYITVASFSGEIVEMPNCKDKSLKSAVQALVDAGLRVGTIMFRVGEIPNIVVEQRYKGTTIQAGKDIQSGESIDLVVEVSSTTASVRMPDILSKTESDAEVLLWKAGLNIGKKTYEGKEEQGHTRVVSYSPTQRTVMLGTAISLNLVNDSQAKYKQELDNFKEENTEVEVTDSSKVEGAPIIEDNGNE